MCYEVLVPAPAIYKITAACEPRMKIVFNTCELLVLVWNADLHKLNFLSTLVRCTCLVKSDLLLSSSQIRLQLAFIDMSEECTIFTAIANMSIISRGFSSLGQFDRKGR